MDTPCSLCSSCLLIRDLYQRKRWRRRRLRSNSHSWLIETRSFVTMHHVHVSSSTRQLLQFALLTTEQRLSVLKLRKTALYLQLWTHITSRLPLLCDCFHHLLSESDWRARVVLQMYSWGIHCYIWMLINWICWVWFRYSGIHNRWEAATAWGTLGKALKCHSRLVNIQTAREG